jgi:hypothetical protein
LEYLQVFGTGSFQFYRKTFCILLLFSTLVAEMLKKLHARCFFYKEIENLRPAQVYDCIIFKISFLIFSVACSG